MRFALLLAVFAILSLSVFATCPNQLVAESDEFKNVPFQEVNSTLTNTVCPRLNGKPSCCPAVVIQAIEVAFAEARLKVLIAKAEISKLSDEIVVLNREFDALVNEINDKESSGELTATQATAFRNFANNVRAALIKFIGNVQNYFIKCLESILTYLAGVVCFGCDPDWSQYRVQNISGTFVVVSQETCDEMNGGCIDLYLSMVQLVLDFRNAYSQLFIDLGSKITLTSNEFFANPCSNGKITNSSQTNGQICKDFICYHLLHGVDTEDPQLSNETSARAVNRAADSVRMGMMQVRTLFHSSEKVDAVFTLTNRVLDASERIHHHTSGLSRAGTTQSNQYSANGVPIYAMGKESSLDKSANSGSALTVASALFVAIALVAALF